MAKISIPPSTTGPPAPAEPEAPAGSRLSLDPALPQRARRHGTGSTGRMYRRDVARTDGQPPWAGPAASVRTVIQSRPDDATYLRCAGCGTATTFGHRDREYGRLVRDFLDRHGQCGNAVEISSARQHAGPPGP